MIGASLSRWTLSYFAAALVALLAGEALMAGGYGFPHAPVQAPETLILVHLIALGWLSLLMSGALLQFVPVLIARPLYSEQLPLPALLLLVGGLAVLLLGFLQIGGQFAATVPLPPIAGVLLTAGFGLNLWNLGRTLWSARPLPLPARFVVVGLVSVTMTVVLGTIFALVLGGTTSNAHLLQVTAFGIPIHIVAGLGGWLTFSAIGVSYRLLAMFMLAPESDGASAHATFTLGSAALAIAIGGGTAAAMHAGMGVNAVLIVAAAAGAASLACYGFDIVRLYRARKRRHIELNSRMAGCALASLAGAAILIAATLILGRLPQHAEAIVFLVAFGWLSGLGLSKLYKIVPFLTWLECYGPVLGKRPTPRVQDLVAETRATKWFWLYFGATWFGTGALLFDVGSGFRVAAAAMTVATIGIVVELIRSRRLVEVRSPDRLPDSVRRPRLFLIDLVR